MSETVFSVGPWYPVQDIVLRSKAGRRFEVDLLRKNPREFCAEVRVHDHVGPQPFDFVGHPPSTSEAASDSFAAALSWAVEYMNYHDQDDVITSVDNPCNTQFLSAEDQVSILNGVGVNATISVNGQPHGD